MLKLKEEGRRSIKKMKCDNSNKLSERFTMVDLIDRIDKCFMIIVLACLLIVVSFVFILASYVIIIQGKDGIIFGGITSFFSGVIGALVAILSIFYKNKKRVKRR